MQDPKAKRRSKRDVTLSELEEQYREAGEKKDVDHRVDFHYHRIGHD